MKRYFAYLRVSTARQGQGTSLDEQKDAIANYAEGNGLTVTKWYVEMVTAAKRGRNEFDNLIVALQQSKANGVIVHKIDRSSRNLRDWADLGELIDKGIDVRFAHENLDMRSRGGRLAADIQAVVAADYIRNLREETKKGFYGRLKQGRYPLPAPIGYRDCGKGIKKPHDVSGKLVRQAFELYATGKYSLETLKTELHERGLRNRKGGVVSLNGMSWLLKNPFYMGVIQVKRTGEVFSGAHTPLVDASLFDSVQQMLSGKNNDKKHRHFFVFRRLLICHNCGFKLVAERQKGHVYYRCHTKNCPQKCVREEIVESQLLARLNGFRFTKAEEGYFRDWIKQSYHNVLRFKQKQSKAIQLQLAKKQKSLSFLTDSFIEGVVDKESYLEKKNELLFEKKANEEKLHVLDKGEEQTVKKVEQFLELAKNVDLSYKSAHPEQKRDLVKVITSNLVVEGKKLVIKPHYPFGLIEKRSERGNGTAYGIRTRVTSLRS